MFDGDKHFFAVINDAEHLLVRDGASHVDAARHVSRR